MSGPVLDLRSPQAFALRHHAGAANIPFADLASRMHELPEKGATLLLYHDSDQALQEAKRFLEGRGYRARRMASPLLDETGPSRHRLWAPSPLLVEALHYAPGPGHAVDLGCGSGREAVHLASLGWQVDAIDILPDALAKARDLASHNDVTINTIELDLRHADLPHPQYDLVAMFRFFNCSPLTRAIATLNSAGLLVVESFSHRDSLRRDNLLQPGELAELCGGMTILICRDDVERSGRWYCQLIARRS